MSNILNCIVQTIKKNRHGNNKSSNINNNTNERKKQKTKKILFVPRWHKVEDGDDDGENVGHSIDDEGLSDEVYSERHAKHLEVMRIEYEEKKKRQAELKEQKKLERLKLQQSASKKVK